MLNVRRAMGVRNQNIWFILGPSGVGKTEFCKHAAARKDWLYFEIDFWKPGIQDGLDCYGLRDSWNEFENSQNYGPLVRDIQNKYAAQQKNGGVFDFPSSRIMGAKQIESLSGSIKTVYLVADENFCLEERHRRERKTRRYLPDSQWHQHNDRLIAALRGKSLKRYCVPVVMDSAKRKTKEELYKEVCDLCLINRCTQLRGPVNSIR